MIAAELFKEYEVSELGFAEGKIPPLKQTYFQLLFVRTGTARLTINANQFSISTHDILILKPGDLLEGNVTQKVECYCLRFSRIYFTRVDKRDLRPDFSKLFTRFEYLLYGHSRLAVLTLASPEDNTMLQTLMRRILSENTRPYIQQRQVFMQQMIALVLHLIIQSLRTVSSESKPDVPGRIGSATVMDYIHYHIYENEKLTAKALGTAFTTTREGIQRMFKAETGESIKQYILKYKIHLAKQRLQYSRMSSSEIAFELGFKDVSHFTKVFKSISGQTPSGFRKQTALS